MRFEVPACNLSALQEEFARLNKKRDRLLKRQVGNLTSNDPLTLTIGETILKDVKFTRVQEGGFEKSYTERNVPFVVVEVTGNAPRVSDNVFIASIEHTPDGNLIRQAMLVELPEGALSVFRDIESKCDHCHTARQRNDTFIIMNEKTMQMKQVGRSCLQDYLGTDDAHSVVALADLNTYIYDICREMEMYSGSGNKRFISLESYLTHVACFARIHGYVSRKMADEKGYSTTAMMAMNNICKSPMSDTYERPIEDDEKQAKTIMEFAQEYFDEANLVVDGLSDYEHNLRIVFNTNYVDFKKAGIAASLYQWHVRKLGDKFAPKKESNYVGNIKDKLKLNVFLKAVYDFDSMYGTMHIHHFVDDDGNVFVWKTNSNRLTPGEKYKIKGTVKEHNQYKNTKQTILTRCSVED